MVPDTRVGMSFGHEFCGIIEEVGTSTPATLCWCPSISPAAGVIQTGDMVVVLGAGPIGIMAARCAWLFGAGRVIIVDHLEYGLDFARLYGPAEVYHFGETGDMAVFIKKQIDSLGADVRIDAVGGAATGNALRTILGKKMKIGTGSALALHWAINLVKKGGIVSIIGVYGPAGNMVPIDDVLIKGIAICANQASVIRLDVRTSWDGQNLPLGCPRLG